MEDHSGAFEYFADVPLKQSLLKLDFKENTLQNFRHSVILHTGVNYFVVVLLSISEL